MNFTSNEIKQIIDEIQQNRSELKNAIDASEARIQLRIEESNTKIRQLEAENTTLKNTIEKLNRQLISNNIIIFGLNKERYEISFEYLHGELKSLLGVEVSENQIKNISCLGSQKNCPVKIELVSKFTKRKIFANCKNLKGTNISISNDLTAQQRKDLAVLKKHLKKYRQNGNKQSFIKGNKLVIEGREFTIEELLEIEGREALDEEERRSDPATPTQALIREPPEEENEKLPQHLVKPPETPKSNGSLGAIKKKKVVYQQIRTRSRY